jgi:hypothetical protein
MRRAAIIAALAVIASIVVGCGSKVSSKWDLLTTKDGSVYRINKQTGEVALIAGTQAVRVEETGSAKDDAPGKSRVTVWPAQQIKQLGGVKTEMKTNWRDGKLYYLFQVSPYAGRIESERHKTGSSALFVAHFYDQDQFEILTLPINLSGLFGALDEGGKVASLTANEASICTLGTYDSIKTCVIGWSGFQESP